VTDTVTIDRRFCGPPESGNGGYTCGLVAREIPAPAARVTLRMPPPLERELVLRHGEEGAVELCDGADLVAEGEPLETLDLEIPEPPNLEVAIAAREASPLHEHHPWPSCFVCGPDRAYGDGLRVIAGPVAGRHLVASPWEPAQTLPAEDRALAPEMTWAALDCPSGNAVMAEHEGLVAALGRLSARIDSAPRFGQTYVATGWPIERDGRKLHSGSALFDRDGELLACAKAVWIELSGDLLGARR
jgi:hypothetical protein